MKKFSALLLIVALFTSASFMTGCENKAKNDEYQSTKSSLEQTQEELDKIKQNSEALDKYIANLKTNINDLKIENQKLIAESKRLEAEIIDLNLELGKIPDSDASNDLSNDQPSSTDAPPAQEDNTQENPVSDTQSNPEQQV